MSTALRILHIYQSSSYSGAEAYALEVALHHAKTNHVTFLAKSDTPLARRVLDSVTIDSVTPDSVTRDTTKQATSTPSVASTQSAMRVQLSTNVSEIDLGGFDLIVLHSTQELKKQWPRLAFAKIRAALARRRAPKVALYSHIWISHSKKDPLHAIAYATIDRFWCSSEKSRSELIRYLPMAPEKIQVVRYGRNTDALITSFHPRTEARSMLGIPQDATVIGTLARVDKGKGSVELFEAVTDLMQSRPELHLLMIGPATDGDPKAAHLDQELHRTIENLTPTIRTRVHKIGRLEAGSRYLTAFDLFVLATYKENFALTLLEAMCAKLPCLATESGGSPDVVRPHGTGWLFLPESTSSLRSTILTALDQKERWAEFGAAGYKLVTENFDFKKVMADLDLKIRALVTAMQPRQD